MNWKEQPSDDWHRETESVEERERLGEMERRLKAARPKPVRFDSVAWERILSASETAMTPEQVTVAMPSRTIPLRRRWSNRVVGTIAAVWLSGVVVGSGVMFLMMNRGGNITQTDNRETPVAVAQQDLKDPSVSPDIRRQSKHDSSDFTSDSPAANAPSSDPSTRTDDGYDAFPVMKLDSMHSVRSVSWLDASVFERDKPLRALDRELLERRTPADLFSGSRHPETLFQKERLQQSESQRELARSFVPPPGATPRRILDHLRIIGPEISAREHDGKLIVVPVKEEQIDAVLDRLKPVPREELSAAFEAVSSYPIQLMVMPPDYLRRTISELLPRLPEELGGGSSEVITEGILWAAFGIDPAELRAELIIQSASEAAAQRLIEHLLNMLNPGTPARELLETAFLIDPSADPQVFESWLSAVRPLVELTREEDRVVVRLEEGAAVAATLPLLNRTATKFQDRLRQNDNSDKFKQILLAMHNHHDTYNAFPPADHFRDEEGNPQLSWRVHLLPFLDERDLFEQFRLDEPWDSPHNAALVEKIPEVFTSRSPDKPGQTTFLAPVGEDTVLGGHRGNAFARHYRRNSQHGCTGRSRACFRRPLDRAPRL